MDLPPLSARDVAVVMADMSRVSQANPGLAKLRPPTGVALFILLLLALMITSGILLPGGWDVLAITACLAAILAVLGSAIVNRPLGALINEQNIMSLSRFQMAFWTIVVLASYFSYALFRIHLSGFAPIVSGGKNDPLNIVIDPNLLILMGIGTTSFVASPMILGTKKDKTPAPAVTAMTALKAGDTTAEVEANRQGTLYGNTRIADAAITDMFQGDELGNTTHIDMAKVQMFFFTIISGVSYLVLVFRNLKAAGITTDLAHLPDLSQLPTLPDGVVYALGISHAGYLTSKGIDHTPVTN